MKSYEEALEWIAREAPDAALAPLGLVDFIYGPKGKQLHDDYQAAKRMVRFRARLYINQVIKNG